METEPQASQDSPSLQQLVAQAFEEGCSDIHLGVGKIPHFRFRGELEATVYPATDEETFWAWVQEVFKPQEIQQFQETFTISGIVQYEFGHANVQGAITLQGAALALRLILPTPLTIEALCLPDIVEEICLYSKGLVLLTSPSGNGKHTTLAAMVNYINQETKQQIVTIEHPIGFIHTSQRSLISQWQVGIHAASSEQALKACLQGDPDVIMISNLENRETLDLALQAAQSSCLVLSTLQTNTVAEAIQDFLGFYPVGEQAFARLRLARTLKAAIAQRLIPTLEGQYRRAAVHEILIATDAVRNSIAQGDLENLSTLIAQGNSDGMCTMHQGLQKLYEAGRISREILLNLSLELQ
jgi:twitching motility protein PilT